MALGNGQALSRAEGYADSIIERLDEVVKHTRAEQLREQYKYVPLSAIVTAGTSIDLITSPAPGAYWEVQRYVITCKIPGTELYVYLNDTQPQFLVDVVASMGAGNSFAVTPGDPLIYVPPASRLIFRFNGVTVGDLCVVNLRVKESIIGEN